MRLSFIRHIYTDNHYRLSTRKLIREISKISLPNYEKTLKSTTNTIPSNFNNANDTLLSMLILVTRRLETFSSLSYITLLNPHIANIWNAYLQSFKELIKFISNYENNPLHFKIINDEQNTEFVNVLKKIIDMHTDNIIELRDGILETKNLSNLLSEKSFLDTHLSERILMRLIANNHISKSCYNINLLDQNLNVLETLSKSIHFVNDMATLKYCEKVKVNIKTIKITSNQTIIDDNINLKNIQEKQLIFPYIGNHIEYILTEILKNSTRATIENKLTKNPINILLLLNTKNSSPTLQIKISDNGNGIHPKIIEKLWEYSFTTVSHSNNHQNPNISLSSGSDVEIDAIKDLGLQNPIADSSIIAGMGYGLPLSLTYCKLFGGSIKLQSVYGNGTDVYVNFKSI